MYELGRREGRNKRRNRRRRRGLHHGSPPVPAVAVWCPGQGRGWLAVVHCATSSQRRHRGPCLPGCVRQPRPCHDCYHGGQRPCLVKSMVASVDLLQTHNHVAPLCVELCTLVNKDLHNVLAAELLQEIVWLMTGGDSNVTGSKASGIKIVAQVLREQTKVWPQVVLVHLSLLLSHLESKAVLTRCGTPSSRPWGTSLSGGTVRLLNRQQRRQWTTGGEGGGPCAGGASGWSWHQGDHGGGRG